MTSMLISPIEALANHGEIEAVTFKDEDILDDGTTIGPLHYLHTDGTRSPVIALADEEGNLWAGWGSRQDAYLLAKRAGIEIREV